MGKEKEKGFPFLVGRGGFSAHMGAGARVGEAGDPAGPAVRGRRRGTTWRRGPTSQGEGRGLTASATMEGEGLDRGSTGGEDPRRFSAVDPVLRRGSGGGA
jgi:hypothetical protein